MRRLAVALAAVALVIVGAERPAQATSGIVVSGVVVLSDGTHLAPNNWIFPNYWQFVTMTETQQGAFVAGTQVEVASLACTFNGYTYEDFPSGGGSLRGSCTGRGVTGVQVSKSCDRVYNRFAQWLVTTEYCALTVGSSTTNTSVVTNSVAQMPPPPTDRYYYTGTATGFPF